MPVAMIRNKTGSGMVCSDSIGGEVVDLFCGVGALSHGLKRAGLTIKAGYDTDRRCQFAFETNNEAKFHARDVARLTPEEIRAHFTGSRPSILAGCAPCQPFSTYKQRYDEDPRWDLVHSFASLAAAVKSDFVTMENVPALAEGKKESDGNQSLYRDAVRYKPARNAVGHTGLLSQVAKNDLNTTHENMKERIRALLSKP